MQKSFVHPSKSMRTLSRPSQSVSSSFTVFTCLLPMEILYLYLATVERIPDATYALVDTRDWLAELLVLLAIRVTQQLGLFTDALVR
jgi:hypothetical protein